MYNTCTAIANGQHIDLLSLSDTCMYYPPLVHVSVANCVPVQPYNGILISKK